MFGGIEWFQTDPHWAPGVVRRALPLLLETIDLQATDAGEPISAPYRAPSPAGTCRRRSWHPGSSPPQ